MLNYYEAWCQMKYWRLFDSVNALASYGALTEGHELPDEFCVAVQSLRKKIERFIDNDVDKASLPFKVKFIPITPENYHTFPINSDGDTIEQVDYFATTVAKEDFIRWAIKKKLQVPEEFAKLVSTPQDTNVDKATKKLLKAAVHAGIFCASQGIEVKKEQLQEELDMYGPSFEEIWKEVPQRYKQPGGRPKKVVEKIINAAVYAAGYVKGSGLRLPKEKLDEKLAENGLNKIDASHLEMIKMSIDAYIVEE